MAVECFLKNTLWSRISLEETVLLMALGVYFVCYSLENFCPQTTSLALSILETTL